MRAHCRLSCAVVARLAECSLRALLGEGGHEVGLSAEAISAIHTLDADADAELDADADAELDAELEAEGQRDEEEEAAATRAVPHQAAPPRAVRVAANDVHALRVAADGDVVSYEVEGYEEKTGIQIDELHADQVVHIQGGKKTVTTVHRKGKERERKELPRAQKDTAGAKGARGGQGGGGGAAHARRAGVCALSGRGAASPLQADAGRQAGRAPEQARARLAPTVPHLGSAN